MSEFDDKNFGCVGTKIITRSGVYFDLLHPQVDMVSINDIAGALSKICRFGGQCRNWYSVAEHSLLCAEQATILELPRGVVFACLMHDAAEAYIGDIVKPLKNLLSPILEAIEDRIEAVIREKFGIDNTPDTREAIKIIDRSMLIHERNMLFAADGISWHGERGMQTFMSLPAVLCLPSAAAEHDFLREFTRRKGSE